MHTLGYYAKRTFRLFALTHLYRLRGYAIT